MVTPEAAGPAAWTYSSTTDRRPGWSVSGACLADVPASDPTLLWHDGRYWLFVAATGRGMSPWDELHLFSAARLADVWEPHPQNPIVADVRRARPAGRIFSRGGELIRPGQDCSVEYGRSNRVVGHHEVNPR